MRRTPYKSAAAPTSKSATDPAEFNAVCRTKPNLPNQTDSNAALLPYLTHQLGSVYEWSGVWNGPYLRSAEVNIILKITDLTGTVYYLSTQLYSTFWKSRAGRIYFIPILRTNYGLRLLLEPEVIQP